MAHELPLLGRLLDDAFKRSEAEGRRLAEALIAGNYPEAIQALARAYLEGRRIAHAVHGDYLGEAATISLAALLVWREQAARHGTRLVTRLANTINQNERFVERITIEAFAETATQQSVWTGHDVGAQQTARSAGAQYKEWVRSWPREEHRDHHDALMGVIIPISEKFTLPGGRNAGTRVYGPRAWDDVNDPGEWLHCGHALRFHREVTRDMLTNTQRGVGTVYEPPSTRRP